MIRIFQHFFCRLCLLAHEIHWRWIVPLFFYFLHLISPLLNFEKYELLLKKININKYNINKFKENVPTCIKQFKKQKKKIWKKQERYVTFYMWLKKKKILKSHFFLFLYSFCYQWGIFVCKSYNNVYCCKRKT